MIVCVKIRAGEFWLTLIWLPSRNSDQRFPLFLVTFHIVSTNVCTNVSAKASMVLSQWKGAEGAC